MAINEDEGDIDTMPVALAKSLMPAKMGIKNPLRENGAKPLDKAASLHPSLPPSAPAQATMPAPIPYYQYLPQYYGAYNGPYHQPGYPLPHQQAAESPKRPRHRSSSLPSEFDSCIDKLAEYIAWLIKRYPAKLEQLTAYLKTLKRKDIVFEKLDTIDCTLWESWEVSDGIRLMLKCHQCKWERMEARRSR